jgi:hypothetical protein
VNWLTTKVLATALGVLVVLLLGSLLALRAATARAELAEAKATAATSMERATAVTWQLSHLQLQGELAACHRQWNDEQTRADRAIALATAGREAAEAELRRFDARWDARTSQCGAALIDMQRACPQLDGY